MDKKISSDVTKYEYPEGSNRVSFVLFNNSGQSWELAQLKSNGMEHYHDAPTAIALIFEKDSVKEMAEQLREIASKLDSF